MWFRRRHLQTTNQKYLKTNEQVEQEEDVNECFMKIDTDNSGTLDVQEMYYAMNENGL
jgi:Ca2+-binding EF-hand superfamily protein